MCFAFIVLRLTKNVGPSYICSYPLTYAPTPLTQIPTYLFSPLLSLLTKEVVVAKDARKKKKKASTPENMGKKVSNIIGNSAG